jgi:hypothetical protein
MRQVHSEPPRGSAGVTVSQALEGEEGGKAPMAKKGSSKVTSTKVARKASAVLRDGRSSPRTRSVAGSALAQATGKGKGK